LKTLFNPKRNKFDINQNNLQIAEELDR